MPATRAVLRDIADIGLDPTVAHTRCAHDGRLAVPNVEERSATLVAQNVPDIEQPVIQEPEAIPEVILETTPEPPAAAEPEKKEEKPKPVVPVVDATKRVARTRRPA